MMAMNSAPYPLWGTGIEGQRMADRGDGTFRNPIVPGDHPDPTILKDGEDYYMSFSSFLTYPGIVLWHSRDLVNWVPVGTALDRFIGSVWALDLVKFGNRYFLYIPAQDPEYSSVYVIWADAITGPWSEPIDLHLEGCIDPGHAVGEDGKRYLFVNGIRRIGLTDDGLATVGTLEKVYEPWRYLEDWVVEMFAPEGPKIVHHNGWFYLVSAVGGTAGPPTSHMVIAARSRSIHGPWEDCPRNPLVRTQSEAEPWWSRGHSSLVEGPDGTWWMVYHGYENGFRTLGRQCLLEPVEWTDDGWFRACGGDLSQPMKVPAGGRRVGSGQALSDDFTSDKRGIQWGFFNPGPGEGRRIRYADRALVLEGKGTSPADSSPLTFLTGDRAYEVEVTVWPSGDAEAGLLLFYSERMFCGLGFTSEQMRTYHYGQEQRWMRTALKPGPLGIRLNNTNQVATFHYRIGDGPWIRHPWQMEVSGMNHNVFGGFTSLKIALFSAGMNFSEFRDLRYRGL